MRRNSLLMLALLLTAGAVALFHTWDLLAFPACQSCGASRTACCQSRVMVTFADGSRRAGCDLHCLVAELMAHPGGRIETFQVADYTTRRLTAADEAFWVMADGPAGHGRKTRVAFARMREAEEYARTHGGAVTNFSWCIRMAYEEVRDAAKPS